MPTHASSCCPSAVAYVLYRAFAALSLFSFFHSHLTRAFYNIKRENRNSPPTVAGILTVASFPASKSTDELEPGVNLRANRA